MRASCAAGLCTGEKGAVRVSKSKKVPPVRLHYKGTSFFRVVPGFICQAGDVTHHPEFMNGRSIYGARFDDEGFKIKHKGAGDLLMANFGIANNNHSQFAVAMDRLTEFESKYVIFGKVLEGMDLLKVMELEGSGEGTTTRKIVIVDCGELDEAGNVRPVDGASAGAVATAPAAELPAGDDDGATEAAEGGGDGDDDDDDAGPVIEEVGDGDDDDGLVLEDGPSAPAPAPASTPAAGAGGGVDDDDDDDGLVLEAQ